MASPVVVVKAWNDREALATVDTVRVRVRHCRQRGRHWIRWSCDSHGIQINHPSCPHTQAFAATPIPAQHPQKGNTR